MKQNATEVVKKESPQPIYQGKNERQNMFIDAYLANAFNISAACRNVGIDRSTYYRWIEDQEFASKLDEARETKKDFIESQLMKKVAAGDTIAIIFACKCLLADRGYVEKNISHFISEKKEEFSKEEIDAAVNAALMSISNDGQP